MLEKYDNEVQKKLSFYEMIDDANPNHRNVTMTVLEGEYMGEKAVFTNHALSWKESENGFFAAHEAEAKEQETDGRLAVVTIAGTRVFREMLGGEKKFVICGGGHVSIPIIQMGLMIGCQVTVLEDRPKFADNARRAGATEVICEPFADGLQKIAGDEDTFFIIVTRGHRYDQTCLESIARKPPAYIGMIGSRRRVKIVKEAIIAGGADPEVVNHVYTPIGLDIDAETPEEIAVAVLAEIIEVKNKRKRGHGYSREIMRAILGAEMLPREERAKVMATIVSRKGSAPRDVGTRMLILPDGTCVGTIGGGCVESDIFQKALLMLRTGETKPQLVSVDMTGEEAEDDGMVCGGIIEVLLEVVAE